MSSPRPILLYFVQHQEREGTLFSRDKLVPNYLNGLERKVTGTILLGQQWDLSA